MDYLPFAIGCNQEKRSLMDSASVMRSSMDIRRKRASSAARACSAQ
jgi:hypothetical protein